MDNIIKISLAFFNFSSLTELPDISKWNIFTSNLDKYKLTTKEVLSTNQNISLLNKKTSSLKETYDDCFVGNIQILNTFSKTTEEYVNNLLNEAYDLNSVFSGCSSLIEMPDISKWNLKKTKNISGLFSGCSSLTKLPDISNWNTINVNNMSALFLNCSSLKYLPDISNWNTNNANDISLIFNGCISLVSLPDISK